MKVSEKPAGFLQFLRDRNPYLFAHHPSHPVFADHFWVFKGLFFCKGCTVTFGGMIFGGILYWATGWIKWFSNIEIGLIFSGLLSPTLITTLFHLPRWTKHPARFLLGVLMTSALIMMIITRSWEVRFVIVLTYLVIRVPLERKRRRENQELLEKQNQRRRKG